MIKGVLNTYDHRFGDNVNSFIKSLSIINLTYKVTKGNGLVRKQLGIQFNSFNNIMLFTRSLEQNYRYAIEEIEESLLINSRKSERLKLISNLILKFKDIQKLLINETTSGFKHENFKTSNVSSGKKVGGKLLDESYCQEYYSEIDQYLRKMLLYLNYENANQGQLNDSEIPLHKINIPAEDKSTKESPLKFFKYLITKKGVSRLLEQFKPSKDDFLRNDIDYDEDSKTITYNHYDLENGHSVTTLSFNDYFIKRLNAEFKNSQRLIKNQFQASKTELEASFFLKQTLTELKRLAESVKSDKNALGYSDIKIPVNDLIKYINSEYIKYIQPEETKTDKQYFFQLKGTKSRAKDEAIDLYDRLVVKEFLNNDSKKDFIKLFTGQEPVNKITWLGNKNQLKPFIDLLLHHKKIEDCKNEKWLITAANFKFIDGEFSSVHIKDAKLPKDKSLIEGIVSKIGP